MAKIRSNTARWGVFFSGMHTSCQVRSISIRDKQCLQPSSHSSHSLQSTKMSNKFIRANVNFIFNIVA